MPPRPRLRHRKAGVRVRATTRNLPPDPMIIYKILRAQEWQEASKKGRFDGAPVDLKDGYIHFSAADQLRGTAAKHFAGEDGLVLLGIETEELGAALKWEPSRGGALFPHLYAPLPLSAVKSVEPLPWNGETHLFPPLAGESK